MQRVIAFELAAVRPSRPPLYALYDRRLFSNMWKLSAPILALVSCAAGLNILLTNDDSWASANIRYVYAALVYECVLNPLARH